MSSSAVPFFSFVLLCNIPFPLFPFSVCVRVFFFGGGVVPLKVSPGMPGPARSSVDIGARARVSTVVLSVCMCRCICGEAGNTLHVGSYLRLGVAGQWNCTLYSCCLPVTPFISSLLFFFFPLCLESFSLYLLQGSFAWSHFDLVHTTMFLAGLLDVTELGCRHYICYCCTYLWSYFCCSCHS